MLETSTPTGSTLEWLNSTQAAEHMNVKLSWLYDHARDIKHYKAGKQLRFRVCDLDAYIESNAVEPVLDWRSAA
jgi:excisionase family DNA binding protein